MRGCPTILQLGEGGPVVRHAAHQRGQRGEIRLLRVEQAGGPGLRQSSDRSGGPGGDDHPVGALEA